MKMEIKEKLQVFQNWIKVITTIIEEQVIEAREDGLHVVGMDPSHVAMINTSFLSSNFESYEVGEEAKVCINVKELRKILDRINKDEMVAIEHSVVKAKLLITTKKGTRIRRFDMPTMADIEGETPEPKIFFKSKVRITIDELTLGLNDAQLVSEHVVFDIGDDVLRLQGNGDNGGTHAQWDKDSDGVMLLKIDEESKATYTMSYIMDIVKALKSLSELVTIELSTDMPIRIIGECPAGVTAEFFLAPCIGI